MQLGGGHLEATLAHADTVYDASKATGATVAGLKESADGQVDAFGQRSRGNGQQGQQGQGKRTAEMADSREINKTKPSKRAAEINPSYHD